MCQYPKLISFTCPGVKCWQRVSWRVGDPPARTEASCSISCLPQQLMAYDLPTRVEGLNPFMQTARVRIPRGGRNRSLDRP